MADQQPAGQIGKYQILSLVGEGAMGNVYRAQDPVLNRTVAVKVMSDAIARDGDLRDRFMREAQAAGSLQHPNVVTIFDFGEFEGHLYIAMEFVAGVDLEIMIGERRVPALQDKLGIIVDVLMGLSYAHKHGVVHRDIKPANIRIAEDGRAKIMDFGIAHLDSAKMTKTGMMMGTPNYMAPEQVTGDKITAATDIFSVGAVLYELLTGNKAFAAETLHSVLYKVVSEEPPPLAGVAPQLPKELSDVVRKALVKDPAMRYQNALEMANDLNAIRTHLADATLEPTSISMSATLARQFKPEPLAKNAPPRAARPQRRTIGVAAASVLGLLVLVWLWTRGTDVAPFPAAAAQSPAPDSVSREVPPPAPVGNVLPPVAASAPAAPVIDTSQASIVRLVRATAVSERARAVQTGALAVALARGDARFSTSDSLFRLRRYAQAVQALNGAMSLWREAERNVASGKQPATVASTSPVGEAVTPPVVSVPAVQSEVVPKREPEPATKQQIESPPVVPRASDAVSPTPTVNTEAELAQIIAEYARAIESRDIARVREVYEALTPEQAQRFTQFFRSVRSLRATFTSASPDVAGGNASTRVRGTYEFVDQTGVTQRQPVSFVAAFLRQGERWRLAAVR